MVIVSQYLNFHTFLMTLFLRNGLVSILHSNYLVIPIRILLSSVLSAYFYRNGYESCPEFAQHYIQCYYHIDNVNNKTAENVLNYYNTGEQSNIYVQGWLYAKWTNCSQLGPRYDYLLLAVRVHNNTLLILRKTAMGSCVNIPLNNDGYSLLMLSFRAMHIYYSWYRDKTRTGGDVQIVSHVTCRNTRRILTKGHYVAWQINVKL